MFMYRLLIDKPIIRTKGQCMSKALSDNGTTLLATAVICNDEGNTALSHLHDLLGNHCTSSREMRSSLCAL